MKTNFLLKFVVFALSIFTFSSFTTVPNSNKIKSTLEIQEETVVDAVYYGYDDSGYNFTVSDEDGNESSMIFQEVDEELLKTFDLKSESLTGKEFTVTFKTRTEVTNGEDDSEEEEIHTITNLVELS